MDEEDDGNCDPTLMKVITSYLSPTRAEAPTQPVPELSVPTTFASILEEVESETGKIVDSRFAEGNSVGTDSAGVENARVEIADANFDRLEMVDFVQAGVDFAESVHTFPELAPEL